MNKEEKRKYFKQFKNCFNSKIYKFVEENNIKQKQIIDNFDVDKISTVDEIL